MNNLLKFGFLGAGAWLLWQKFMSPAVAESAPPTQLPAANSTTSSTTPSPDAVTQAQSTATRDMVLAAARRSMPATWDSLLNVHQWNFFHESVRGVPGPDPDVVWPGRDHGNYRMSVDEWWAGVSSRGGLSGLSNYAFIGGRNVPIRPW